MPVLDLSTVSIPLRWAEVFGRSAPVDVDLGAGKGRFLCRHAEAHPERDVIAVERALKYHRIEAERVAKRGLENVRCLHTTAEDLLFRLLEPDTVDVIYALHPDPWPKKRHHKRRLIDLPNTTRMVEVLRPGGLLLIKTDHPDYAEVIADILGDLAGVDRVEAEAVFAALPETGFEVKYRQEGREIAVFGVQKRAATAG